MKKSEVMAKNQDLLDFEKDISINKYKLDEECLSHSSIYARYSLKQVEAKIEISKAKDFLELIQSERNLSFREGLVKIGTKTTESMIDKLVSSDTQVIEAKEKLREAEDIYSKLSVAVSAFEHRKSELDNLVKLYCSGYYSIPNSNSEAQKNINERTSRDVRKNLNKSTKE